MTFEEERKLFEIAGINVTEARFAILALKDHADGIAVLSIKNAVILRNVIIALEQQ